MKLRSLAAAALVLVTGVTAHASTISFIVNADQLLNSSSVVVPDGAAVFIVAATTGNIVAPPPGTYTVGSTWTVGGNTDLLIYAVGSETESGEQGVVDSNPSVPVSGGLAQNDPLALFWFPAATYSGGGTLLSNGASYGIFDQGSVGDDAPDWITPSPGTSDYNLLYLTPSGALLGPGNDVGTFGTIGSVPEPSTFAFIGGILALGAVLRRRLAAVV